MPPTEARSRWPDFAAEMRREHLSGARRERLDRPPAAGALSWTLSRPEVGALPHASARELLPRSTTNGNRKAVYDGLGLPLWKKTPAWSFEIDLP